MNAQGRIEPCEVCGAAVAFNEVDLGGGLLAYRVVSPAKAWVALRIARVQRHGVMLAVKAFCSARCAGAYSLLERDPNG